MKTMRKFLILILFISMSCTVYAQHRHENRGRHRRHTKVVVVHRSHYRPARIKVFHPVWRPAYGFHRRWVFFPHYNFYWDNWRNHYVFWNGTVWFSQPTPPPIVVNVNLEKEKTYELRDDEDDHDDVYQSNDAHKQTYRSE